MTQQTGSFTHVHHDGIARQTFHRETSDQACAWCGQHPRLTFTYQVESDAQTHCPQPTRGTKAFCNLGCFYSYVS
jgi:hypothetical protein